MRAGRKVDQNILGLTQVTYSAWEPAWEPAWGRMRSSTQSRLLRQVCRQIRFVITEENCKRFVVRRRRTP